MLANVVRRIRTVERGEVYIPLQPELFPGVL